MSNVLQNTGGNTLKVHGGGVFGSAAAVASGWASNEPAGFTSIFDRQWDALPPDSPTKDVYGFTSYAKSNASIVATSTEGIAATPDSNANVLKVYYPEGSVGGAAINFGNETQSTVGVVSAMYHCFYLYLPSTWDHPGSNVNVKLFFISQDGANNHFVNLTRGDTILLAFDITTQGSHNVVHESGTSLINDLGRWYKVELLYKAETSAGAADAVAQGWVDGVESYNYTNIEYFNLVEARQFTSFLIQPTASSPTAVPAGGQEFYMGRQYASGLVI